MTAAALVPLAFLALMTLIVVLAVRSLSNSKRDDAADADFAWLPQTKTYLWIPGSETDATPAPAPVAPPVAASEPPPTAEVIRMPVRLYVVQGGRR